MKYVSIDFETCSTADLRRTGVFRYAEDRTTRVIVACYSIDGGPIQTWFACRDPMPNDLLAAAKDPAVQFHAWNAQFEATIWTHIVTMVLRGPIIHPDRWHCTMARAMYWGLPARLEDAAAALRLPYRKDMNGHRLMLRMCRPRAMNAAGKPVWWHEEDPQKLADLAAYCATDVQVEQAIHDNTPDLPDRERKIWLVDQQMNRLGVAVDVSLVNRLAELSDLGKADLDSRIRVLTSGQVRKTSQTAPLLAWLQAQGYPHDNIRRATVFERLAEIQPGTPEHTGLTLRADAARTSTAKLQAMLDAMCADFQIRGMLQYYGAGRTGRWAGRLVQPQNLPRGSIKDVLTARHLAVKHAPAEALEMLFEDGIMGIVASLIRACLRAPVGAMLVCADSAQIEARVVAWLAGQQDILDVFARGEDVYVYTAKKVGSDNRQLGKTMALGLGFGMGAPKFQGTAKLNRVILTAQEAEDNVRAWRQANPKIVAFWYDCDRAARAVVGGEQSVAVGRVTFARKGKRSMSIILPSGRELIYRNIGTETDPDTGRDALVYDGVNQYTKKWGPIRTYGGKLVENITQAVARDVMADAMVASVSIPRFTPRLTVHDELIGVSHAFDADDALAALLKIMRTTPAWAPGLPVGAEGWTGEFYRK